MRKARLAERMLSLVVTPDSAASIVGDLVEVSPGGRTPWISVARIGISLLWKDVSARPGRMLCLATAGAAMNLIILAPFGATIFLVTILLGLLGARLNGEVTIAVNTVFVCLAISAAVPAPFMTGRWIARRSPGRELAPCLTLTILAFAVWGAFCLGYGEGVTLMNGLSGILPGLACLTVAACSLNAGAVWSRKHAGSVWSWFERVPFEENWAKRKSLWDLLIPADHYQQKICDALLLMEVILVLPAVLFATFDTAARVLMVPLLLFEAIATQPMQWMRPSSRLVAVFGRLFFVGLAIGVAIIRF